MNGNANGAIAPLVNGDGAAGPQSLFQIVEALEAIHSAQSTNESRRQASIFLEQAKTSREAPYHGFTLASDRSQLPVVRHFALSLLEYAIKHNWTEYSLEQSGALRGWVLQLARDVNGQDPLYIRNKIAQLWVELAKRSWASEWIDMDELLVRLWAGPIVQKELVLLVLETLSEDVFNREDSAAALRGTQLNRACVDIFTPASVLAENFPARDTDVNVRFGDEGWLARLGDLLEWCLEHNVGTDEEVRACAIKTLAALKAAMQWVMHKATAAVHCTEHICKSLTVPSVPVQMEDDFLALVCPMYGAESVNLLKRLYEWSVVDATNVDEEKYLLSKKFSEMISNLGNFIEQRPLLIPGSSDLSGFLNLMLNIMSHQSMTVSLPVLSTWVKLLKSDTTGQSDAFDPLVGSLLDICSQRLIKYESLPEDSDDPSLVFLLEDIDTMPERHTFVGVYRRYCVQVVETIVKRRPFDAMCHILAQTSHSLKTLYDGQPPFRIETYKKNSVPALRVDAHFTVVEAALKGYVKWIDSHGSTPQQDELERSTMETNLESWCEQLLGMDFKDPLIKKRALQLAVTFSTTALDKRAGFMLKVLEHILMTRPTENPAYPAHSDAVKDLQHDCAQELHRLAMKMPDHLLVVYDQLEAKIEDIVAEGGLDDKQRLSYYMFLFIITHRATTIDPQLRESRLQNFVNPIKLSWQDAELTRSVSTFQGFCGLLGLGRVQEYLVSRQVHKIEDWSQYQLDAEGLAIQTELNERFQLLPLRPTKSFIGVSNDKLIKGSTTYNTACALWQDVIPIILPNLLQFLSHCHAFHNPLNWTGLPEELRPIVTRVLTDRFWQAGISTGSKDDFYARVGNTRTTMEGFASSIRGAVRMVRETCYSILFCMSRLDIHFYGFVELPGPLAQALFADAHALSSHQMSVLLNVARFLVDDCPANLRAHFLPPILASLFTQVDSKVSSEWEQLTRKAQATSDDDSLTQEMKEESILRQLTYSAVLMVAGLLDPQREAKPHTADVAEDVTQALMGKMGNASPAQPPKVERRQPMRDFILSSDAILEPLILFCTHALRLRDQRCCSVIIRVFRSIVPKFSENRPDIREFICNEVLKASITSLHEDYFVELQRELAQLIATIFILYSPHSNTPRHILLSLPGVEERKLDLVAKQLFAVNSGRQQRALILDLLQGLRGQSIAEQGQITRPPQNQKPVSRDKRMSLQQHLISEDQEANKNRGASPDLGGLVDMFR
ncbi:hypothetical protein GP486_005144 [Trichoglossum hirsutum]|uniref:Importin N-terminal domain-containing protein n=1 Tax=Trichoglossum hirsutum TaxID=265104 RepID=A0A9P8L9U2_9PEZI|nr:hypothetical protein GP486_005144 [Trichoglossum hirsutum]